jgi:hypothetical protein
MGGGSMIYLALASFLQVIDHLLNEFESTKKSSAATPGSKAVSWP